MFMCNIRVGETARALQEDRAAIQRDLSILEEWASKDCVMAKTVASCTLDGAAILGAAGQVASLQKKTGRS